MHVSLVKYSITIGEECTASGVRDLLTVPREPNSSVFTGLTFNTSELGENERNTCYRLNFASLSRVPVVAVFAPEDPKELFRGYMSVN